MRAGLDDFCRESQTSPAFIFIEDEKRTYNKSNSNRKIMKTEYHKIQTIFKRDPKTNYKTLLMGDYSLPEFNYLANNIWQFTEKVDGTNIRIILNDEGLSFGGRTEKAQMPDPLVNRLNELFCENILREQFEKGVVLYGEGYGNKIQKVGHKYKDHQDFVLFDVKVGDYWLDRETVDDIASKLGIESVPIVGEGTLNDMIKLCQDGMLSRWGDFGSEGLIGRPKLEMKSRSGDRIITKLKTRDFSS